MNEPLVFRRAQSGDMPHILRIIEQAQAQMKALGSRQWQDGYPAQADIERDIANGYGYVFDSPGGASGENYAQEAPLGVIAYGAVIFGREPAYDAIEGGWLTDNDYVVLHRLAVADAAKQRGIAAEFVRRVESLARGQGIGSFRVDTNFDNRYMLRLLDRAEFVYCGKIHYQSGERLAFEKILRKK